MKKVYKGIVEGNVIRLEEKTNLVIIINKVENPVGITSEIPPG